ncbi:MAG TPA: hypothetical protein VGV89_03800 [Thermoplasmata archaeon]|nr:hypothetical protein [Thermoplasmata archaeon]
MGRDQWRNVSTSLEALGWSMVVASKLGWHAIPTAKNSAGPDLLLVSKSGSRPRTLQVKGTRNSVVPLGKAASLRLSDYVVIFDLRPLGGRNGGSPPISHAATPKGATRSVSRYYGEDDSTGSLWLPEKYWSLWKPLEDVIGRGDR